MRLLTLWPAAAFTALLALASGCQNDPATTKGSPPPPAEEHFYANLKRVSNQGGVLTITLDRIEFLTGEAAVAAARKDDSAVGDVDAKGDTTWWVANDYYIVNPDSTLQIMEVAPNATVQLIDLPNSTAVASTPAALLNNEQLDYWPFELTARNGKLVAIRAQFVP